MIQYHHDISVSYSITVFGHWNASISSIKTVTQWPKMDGHDVFFDFSHLLCRSVASDSTDRRSKNISGRHASIASEAGIASARAIRLADPSAWHGNIISHPVAEVSWVSFSSSSRNGNAMADGNSSFQTWWKVMINQCVFLGLSMFQQIGQDHHKPNPGPTGSPYHCRSSRKFHRNTRGHTGNVHASVSTCLNRAASWSVVNPEFEGFRFSYPHPHQLIFIFRKLTPENRAFWW